MAAINPENIFPEINFERLEFYAAKWVQKWPVIEKITLYPGAEGESKFVLVFETSKAPPAGTAEFDLWQKERRRYRDAFSDPINEALCLAVRDDLVTVNKKVPPDEFLNQWTCWSREPGDGLFSNGVADPSYRAPIVEDQAFSVCLYPKAKPDKVKPENLLPDEVIEIAKKIRPEVEEIFQSIKDGTRFSEQGQKGNECRKQAALDWLQEYPNDFKYLDKNILDNAELYRVGSEQTKRDIIGRVLKKAVKERKRKNYPAVKLYYASKNT